jgi:mannitol/fructose-specific phosphotransferase system IIA component (Ntr-type)
MNSDETKFEDQGQIIFPLESVITELQESEKNAVIRQMVSRLVHIGQITTENEDLVVNALIENGGKEKSGIGFGLAVPCAYMELFKQPVVAFGLSAKGIEWDSVDAKPVHCVFLILHPPKNQFPVFIKSLAAYAKILRKHFGPEDKSEWFNKSASEIWRFLNKQYRIETKALDLADILEREQIIAEMKAQDRWQAIEELADKLVATDKIKAAHRDAVVAAAKKRESSDTTAMASFAVIPADISKELMDIPVCALGYSKAGIDFHNPGEEHVKFVVLLIRPGGFESWEQIRFGIRNLFFAPWVWDLQPADADAIYEIVQQQGNDLNTLASRQP